ncbi:MAG: hypothetical protein IKP68_13175 [Clostridia bacterium]|nr:hypothetical protein [Clostridia bacterium]
MEYSIILHTPTGAEAVFSSLCCGTAKSADGNIAVTMTQKKISVTVTLFELTATGEGECYFSLCGKGNGKFTSFDDFVSEEHIFRQSPHDPAMYRFSMDASAVPMIAAVTDGGTDIFVSDEPSHCDNYTTQRIVPESHEFYLSSGDPGGAPNHKLWNYNSIPTKNEPYYHDLSKKPHVYRFLKVSSDAKTIKRIRRDAFLAIEKTWGSGSDSIYRAMCFGANYMHIRKNETGTSDKWVVAGIQYANTMYDRDAFWQTMILSPEIERQCYLAHTKDWIKHAENPLFFIIWSYRVYRNGGEITRDLFDFAFGKMIEGLDKVGDGRYCPDGEADGSFRNWFDICCFEYDDADSYSEGLCLCALRAARELGYDIGDRYEKAKAFYISMFNGRFMPLSLKKQYLAVDYSIGDLLHFLLFNEKILPDEIVQKTYAWIEGSAAKTPYGTKVVADVDGSFLPMEAFGAYGKVHPEMARLDLGRYANGGSYHIYEMLFHIAAFVHGADGALDNMIWRLMVDLDFDGATHEYMHTIKGNGVKANQGWNAAIYAIWEELIRRGVGDKRFFDAAEEKLRGIE